MVLKSYYLNYGSTTLKYSIERSARRKKTIGILIHPDKGVVVRAPRRTSISYIEKLIELKAAWIVDKIQVVNAIPRPLSREYRGGETLSYLGSSMRLVVAVTSNKVGSVQRNDDRLTVFVPQLISCESRSEYIKHMLQRWYVNEAKDLINRLVTKYSGITGLVPNKISIKNFKRSWASCTGGDNIGFNWRLMMAPLPVVEYVVVHELCHIKEKNHSQSFWSLLGRYLPDFIDSRNQLKLSGHTYEL